MRSRRIYSLTCSAARYCFTIQGKTGDLIKRVTADTGCVRELVMRVFVPGVQSVLTLIGMFVIMWQMSPGLAIFALLLEHPVAYYYPTSRRTAFKESLSRTGVAGSDLFAGRANAFGDAADPIVRSRAAS